MWSRSNGMMGMLGSIRARVTMGESVSQMFKWVKTSNESGKQKPDIGIPVFL